jgi:hypothetical protein
MAGDIVDLIQPLIFACGVSAKRGNFAFIDNVEIYEDVRQVGGSSVLHYLTLSSNAKRSE